MGSDGIGLAVRDLTVEFSSGGYRVRPLDHLDLSAASGERVLLVGASGSGKTTLLSCMAGILTPTSGSIRLGDLEVTGLRDTALTEYRRHRVGVVFQAFNLIPSLSAVENVQAPLRLSGVGRKAARARAEALIERVGLADRARHRPQHLSGGEQQRVAIARALAHDPPLILADEPTAHLDYIQVESVLELLRELAGPGRIVLVATHDERLIPLADRVLEVNRRAAPVSRPPEPVVLLPGEVLFRQGDPGDLIYEVDEGEIEIVRERADGGIERVTVVLAGAYFGELAPLLGLRRSATARAVGPARVTGLSVVDFRARTSRSAPEPRPIGAPAPIPGGR